MTFRPPPSRGSFPLRTTLEIGMIVAGIGGMALSGVLAYRATHLQPAYSVAGGAGTKTDPYQISTCDNLQSMAQVPGAAYALTAEIDCTDTATWNEGEGFFPIGYFDRGFSGTLDGAGFGIVGLSITRPTSDYIGLFGKLNASAVVKNVRIQGTVQGRNFTGLLAGWVLPGARIEQLSLSGAVTGNRGVGGAVGVNQGSVQTTRAAASVRASEDWAGGLIGWNDQGALVERSDAQGNVTGRDFVGGLIGINHSANIHTAHATGDVRGRENVGGFIGLLSGEAASPATVTDCYASGTVRSQTETGGLIGKKQDAFVLENCFTLGPR